MSSLELLNARDKFVIGLHDILIWYYNVPERCHMPPLFRSPSIRVGDTDLHTASLAKVVVDVDLTTLRRSRVYSGCSVLRVTGNTQL